MNFKQISWIHEKVFYLLFTNLFFPPRNLMYTKCLFDGLYDFITYLETAQIIVQAMLFLQN